MPRTIAAADVSGILRANTSHNGAHAAVGIIVVGDNPLGCGVCDDDQDEVDGHTHGPNDGAEGESHIFCCCRVSSTDYIKSTIRNELRMSRWNHPSQAPAVKGESGCLDHARNMTRTRACTKLLRCVGI